MAKFRVLIVVKTKTRKENLLALKALEASGWGVMLSAQIDAVQNVLARAGLAVGDVDLFEVNEAFAVVALAVEPRHSRPRCCPRRRRDSLSL